MILDRPVQRSSPFWIGVTGVSQGTPSTTVWHKPRRVFPSLPSAASPVIAEWEVQWRQLLNIKRCCFYSDWLLTTLMEFCCHDSLVVHSITLFMNNEADEHTDRGIKRLQCTDLCADDVSAHSLCERRVELQTDSQNTSWDFTFTSWWHAQTSKHMSLKAVATPLCARKLRCYIISTCMLVNC